MLKNKFIIIPKEQALLIAIVLLATFLRFSELNSLPALNADEAAIGYNVYSLLQTGKDEHGNPWPIHFQSFNDWKPGLYFYIALPFVALFGLTEMAVRLPGVLLGIATVFLVWLLSRELFSNKRWLPELSALFLAISPWHIHFSRGGWEVNAATFFITAGVWAFIKSLKEKNFLYVSVIFFVASLYTYHAARIVVPLLVIGLLVVYRKWLLSHTKSSLLAGFVGVLLLAPLAIDLTGPAGLSRASGVGLFADTGPFWRINYQRGEHSDLTSIPARALHNKPVNYGLAFLENYADHFWGEFLFISGDVVQRNKVSEMGQMYLLDFVFIVAGFFAIARNSSGWGAILIWLLTAPLAAALTFQSPHALRAQNMVVPLVIISAFGALSLVEWLQAVVRWRPVLLTTYYLLLIIFVWDFTRYLHQYYVHMEKTYDFSSQHGVKELMFYIRENQDKYSKIIITDKYDQPYVLTLFYLRYPPEKFQGAHVLTSRDQFGFSTVREFDNFVFRDLPFENWDKIKAENIGALIVGSDKEIPDAANVLKTVYFPSGRIAFQAVAN